MATRRRPPFTPIVQLLRARYPDHPDVGRLVADQRVLVDGRVIANPNALVRRDAALRVLPERRLRGDVKLSVALEAFGVDIAGAVAVDVGAAAGGFTTALLRAGALRVYAVDVGYGQLLGALRADLRVVNLERTDVAELDVHVVPDAVDVLTVDLSYTSIAEAVGSLHGLRYAPHARLIALVKPTFELAAGHVVLDRDGVRNAVAAAVRSLDNAGWTCQATTLPTVTGRHGAIEVFVLAARACGGSPPPRGGGSRRDPPSRQDGRQPVTSHASTCVR
jgi:23S rRNA (cytidine1920-2'-O)/16S rRNA (cytidine1409-2'-O)-methyltransferase